MVEHDDLLETVRGQLLRLGLAERDPVRIRLDSLLIDDLGLDSLRFVDLTVGLEEALGVDEFPMQHWVDRQLEAMRPLDVAGLVAVCRELLDSAQAVR